MTITLVGQGTHWLQGETTATFGSGISVDQLNVTDATDATAQITILSTASLGFQPVTLYTDGETASIGQGIDVEQETPGLLSSAPNNGVQGTTFQRSGPRELEPLAAGSVHGELRTGHFCQFLYRSGFRYRTPQCQCLPDSFCNDLPGLRNPDDHDDSYSGHGAGEPAESTLRFAGPSWNHCRHAFKCESGTDSHRCRYRISHELCSGSNDRELRPRDQCIQCAGN